MSPNTWCEETKLLQLVESELLQPDVLNISVNHYVSENVTRISQCGKYRVMLHTAYAVILLNMSHAHSV